jgi:hypothetical protein
MSWAAVIIGASYKKILGLITLNGVSKMGVVRPILEESSA